MTPTQALEMPIPFGISSDNGVATPLESLDDATLENFNDSDDPDSEVRDYLDQKVADSGAHRGVVGDIRDANDLDETQWGVIFAPSAGQEIRDALAPLLKHRGIDDPSNNPRVFSASISDTAESWLSGRKVSLETVRPSLGVPFYLLIVGPPHEISYEFQFRLDLYWAVGRIWFETPDEFRQYAESVVRYETMPAANIPTSKQMAVFATSHELDPATQKFSREVANVIVTGDEKIPRAGLKQKFAVQSFIGPSALRSDLQNILKGEIKNGPPALLFSGSHGKAFGADTPEQAQSMGAIICGDWQGVGSKFTREHYFDAADLAASNCKTHGMIHFLFACYGGGWPAEDTFSRRKGAPKTLASRAMMARLPQVLLSHRNGGALAVLAHVDRAWAYSWHQGQASQIQPFSDVIAKLMWGDRVGNATDQFNMRWASLSSQLLDYLDNNRGLTVDSVELANKWIARDDARNYVVFGDPAVCLRTKEMPVISD